MDTSPRRTVSLRRVARRVMFAVATISALVGSLGGPLGLVALRRRWALAAALAACVGCRLHTERPPVAEQAVAPELELPAHDGRTVSLGELLARGPALLVFYRGHW